MDNHTRNLLGLTDIHLHFDDDWLEERRYKGVQAQFIKVKLITFPCRCKNYGSLEIIRNGSLYVPFSDAKNQRKADYLRIETFSLLVPCLRHKVFCQNGRS
ncbi:hypothetical protein GCM10019994_27280 [Enterococcus raffinosus]